MGELIKTGNQGVPGYRMEGEDVINIGYACLALAVPGSAMKNCTLKNAGPDHLLALIQYNLEALEKLIEYNIAQGILLFRISSDLIPFGSSLAMDLPWREVNRARLARIGALINDSGMRVSMHPGQYTVLNSPDEGVVQRAVADLAYHTGVLDGLGVGSQGKIILHLGGVYGDKASAIQRFIERYQELDPAIKRRLVLENDDRLFNIEDILQAQASGGFPVVYDNLHNAVNPSGQSLADRDWIKLARSTWKPEDGPQKIHYSQQSPAKRIGAHSQSIQAGLFLEFYKEVEDLEVDIMLEVKDKNLSAVKCLNLVTDRGIEALEEEWSRYKYTVLERSPNTYQAIRQLLKSKTEYPVREFYRLIESALASAPIPGQAVNAAQHVWGYFKDQAAPGEKKRFEGLLDKFLAGEIRLELVKNHLARLAGKYQETYLLQGYYFDL